MAEQRLTAHADDPERGLRLFGNLTFEDEEYTAELHYGFHLTDWFTIRPNLPYIWDPGGVEEVDDALVFGFKLQVQL